MQTSIVDGYEQSTKRNRETFGRGKLELLDVLWNSLEADAAGLTNEQRAELDSRVAKYEQNPSDAIR